jgi:hypothetical protein
MSGRGRAAGSPSDGSCRRQSSTAGRQFRAARRNQSRIMAISPLNPVTPSISKTACTRAYIHLVQALMLASQPVPRLCHQLCANVRSMDTGSLGRNEPVSSPQLSRRRSTYNPPGRSSFASARANSRVFVTLKAAANLQPFFRFASTTSSPCLQNLVQTPGLRRATMPKSSEVLSNAILM